VHVFVSDGGNGIDTANKTVVIGTLLSPSLFSHFTFPPTGTGFSSSSLLHLPLSPLPAAANVPRQTNIVISIIPATSFSDCLQLCDCSRCAVAIAFWTTTPNLKSSSYYSQIILIDVFCSFFLIYFG
jgi:hypothetical protein